MTRESAETKAARYLREARITVTRVADGEVDAIARGDGAIYELGYRRGEWFCPCPARGRCAHLLALGMITAPSRAAYR